MTVFAHVLVATDFEASASRAVDYAVRLAEQGQSRLTLLHVYTTAAVLPTTEGVTVVDALPAVRDVGQSRLDELVSSVRARFANVNGVLRAGDPKTEILEAAKELGADLIVVGTQGRKGIARMILGSVAEYVVRNATVPVLTIRSRE